LAVVSLENIIINQLDKNRTVEWSKTRNSSSLVISFIYDVSQFDVALISI